MIAGQALFYATAVAMVLTALGMVLARNVVHAALLMVAHFLMTAVIYVLLQASFVAVVQVAVYAGAIMVLFLFVVMLLGNRPASLEEHLAGQRPIGVVLVVLLAGMLAYVVRDGVPAAGALDGLAVPAGFGSPGAIADLLFREYLLPLEIVSVLLLVAMLGAVVVARTRRSEPAVGSAVASGAASEGAIDVSGTASALADADPTAGKNRSDSDGPEDAT